MTDFKNTLNLPKTSFPMKGNLPSKEPLIQKKWKEENLKIIVKRMQGWQLETFNESYEHKKNKGISLFKKNLLETKN